MAEYRTAEESLTQNIAVMGEALGSQFSALWQRLALLHAEWGEFVELFGTKPERVELLNRAAPSFFRIVQDELWDAILLGITRLTDSSKIRGRENLTIRNLAKLIPDTQTKASVEKLVQTAIDKSQFCRDWRNRRIAHLDLALALNGSAKPLEGASRLNVREALAALVAVLNAVELHYNKGSLDFDTLRLHDGGPNTSIRAR